MPPPPYAALLPVRDPARGLFWTSASALSLCAVLAVGVLLSACAAGPARDPHQEGSARPLAQNSSRLGAEGGRAAGPSPMAGVSELAPQALLGQALYLLRSEQAFDPARALEILDRLEAQGASPTDAASVVAPARVLRLLALRMLGRAQEAVAAADALLLLPRSGPESLPPALLPDVFVERGGALAFLERFERAREDYAQALALNPRHVGALMARGDLAFAQGEAAAAEADYGRAIDVAPREVLAYINRGVARDEQGRFAEAVADFTEALRLDPEQATAYANRGISLSQLGDFAGMCRDYNAACRLGDCARLLEARELDYCLP